MSNISIKNNLDYFSKSDRKMITITLKFISVATISSITVGVIAFLAFGLLIFLALAARRRRLRREKDNILGNVRNKICYSNIHFDNC